MPHIVTLTLSPALDLSAYADEVVTEHKIRFEDPRFDPGGGGINVSRVASRFGCDTLAIYPSAGLTGALLGQLLDGEGVPRHEVPALGLTRESVTIAERASGREYRFVLPGPALDWEAAAACMDVLRALEPGTGYVVASGSLPEGVDEAFYARLSPVVARAGARFVVDTSGRALSAALAAGVWMAKPNRRELESLVGGELADDEALAAASRDLVARGAAELLVVSLGADGAMLTTRDRQLRGRPPSVRVKSAVGAGDSFTAGLLVGLSRGESLADAFALAIASGTGALLTPGTALCRREDAERLRPHVEVWPV